MNDLDLGWLVGLLEGEGSLQLISTLHKGYKGAKSYQSISTKITFYNTDYEIIKRLIDILDNMTLKMAGRRFRDRKNTPGKKRVYEITVSHYKDLKNILDLVEPHLVSVKKDQASIIRKYVSKRLEIMALYPHSVHPMRKLTEDDFLIVDQYKRLKIDVKKDDSDEEVKDRWIVTNKIMNQTVALGWLIGLLEGEGHLQLIVTNHKGYNGRKPCRYIVTKITFYNTDERIICKLKDILDSLKIKRIGRVVRKRKNHFGSKPVYEVTISQYEDIKTLLDLVGPHLVSTKREQAELIRTFVSRRLEKMNLYKSAKHPLRKLDSEDYLLVERYKELRG